MKSNSLEPLAQPSAFPETLKSVLLVEDDSVFQFQLKDILLKKKPDISVHTFTSGIKAIQAIKKLEISPNLALIDIGLPDINGNAVIQSLCEISPSTPSLVISVINNETKLLEAIRSGAKGYLLKGESPAAIIRGIQEVLEGNYPISPSLARNLFKLAGAPNSESEKPTFTITPRERETLHHISQGLTYGETAIAMKVSLSTIQTHIKNLYRKLGVNSQTQAILKAKQTGVL